MIRNRCSVTNADQTGATMLEFVVVGPLLLLTVLVTLDLLRISYNALTLQFVVTRIAREAVLGESVVPAGYSREIWIRLATAQYARNLGVAISANDVSVCPIGDSSCTVDYAGAPKEFFVLSASVPSAGLVVPGSLFNLSSSVIAKNEPR